MRAIVICSTWLLGSGTFPTRMSRAVSMRRLVSVSSNESPSGGKLVQGNIVLDVFRDEHAILLRHSSKIARGKRRIGRQVGELLALDDVAYAPAGKVGLEVGLDSRDSSGFFGFVVGDKLGELLFQQF